MDSKLAYALNRRPTRARVEAILNENLPPSDAMQTAMDKRWSAMRSNLTTALTSATLLECGVGPPICEMAYAMLWRSTQDYLNKGATTEALLTAKLARAFYLLAPGGADARAVRRLSAVGRLI